MLYTLLCTFRPGAFAQAKTLRQKHYEFLAQHKEEIVEGGPLVGADGTPTAMLMVVDKPTEDAAHAFISGEPYTHAGFFESVAVRQWHHVIPEPMPGYVESELAKEREANLSAERNHP